MSRRNILVTGAAGYLGTTFLRAVRSEVWAGEILGIDRRKPLRPVDGVVYEEVDILSSRAAAAIKSFSPDVLVHLAFIVDPILDERAMTAINVNGTQTIFEAAAAAGVKQILYASSATAYGAYPDNPIPLRESDPIRGHRDFSYARDKRALEVYCEDFARAHANCTVSIIRPVIVFGPGVSNYLSRFVFASPIVPLVGGGDTPIQFVHEQDVANIMVEIVRQQRGGAFNVAGDEWLTMREVCQLAKRPTIGVPRALLERVMSLLWRHYPHKVEAPPSVLDFLEHPWVVCTRRVREELGYRMKYSSRDAVVTMIESRNCNTPTMSTRRATESAST